MIRSDMETFRNIKTGRLLLRPLAPEDGDALFVYRSLPEVYRFQSFRPGSVHDAEEFIARSTCAFNVPGAWFQLGICLKGGELIGDLGLHFTDGEQAEIGYTVAPAHQGRGYACEAAEAALECLFTALKKHRVTASVDPENAPSVRLLEKLGMRREAHFIQSWRSAEGWRDDCVYALLAEEWRRRQAAFTDYKKQKGIHE